MTKVLCAPAATSRDAPPLKTSIDGANPLVRTEQATDDIGYSESARQGQDRGRRG